jgi:hypothetical protein
MTHAARLAIAAAVTVLFLVAISAAGLVSRGHLLTPVAAAPVPAQPTSVQPAPALTHYEEHD